MRWPWRAKPEDVRAADEALEQSKRGLQEEQQRLNQVRETARSLRDFRRRNHFGEAMMELFKEAK